MDDITDIERLYSGDPEREDSRLERHQLEYDLTWRYLERYLPSSGDILEIGAATAHARRAAVGILAVDVDLVPRMSPNGGSGQRPQPRGAGRHVRARDGLGRLHVRPRPGDGAVAGDPSRETMAVGGDPRHHQHHPLLAEPAGGQRIALEGAHAVEQIGLPAPFGIAGGIANRFGLGRENGCGR